MEVTALHGTLIVAIPCKEGLLVCADKKMTITGVVKRVLEVVKIHQLGSHAAFGLAGNPIFYNPVRPSIELYNVVRIVTQFYSTTDTRRIRETWNELVETVQQSFSRFLAGLTFEQAPPSGPPPDHYLFHIPFWYVDADRQLGTTTISLTYLKERGMTQLFKMDESADTFEIGRAFAWGSVEVFNELKSGNDARFDAFRSEPGIRRLLREYPPARDVEVGEADTVAKRIIAITRDNMQILTPNKQDVGKTTDSALIHRQEGLKWITVRDNAPPPVKARLAVVNRKKKQKKKRRR